MGRLARKGSVEQSGGKACADCKRHSLLQRHALQAFRRVPTLLCMLERQEAVHARMHGLPCASMSRLCVQLRCLLAGSLWLFPLFLLQVNAHVFCLGVKAADRTSVLFRVCGTLSFCYQHKPSRKQTHAVTAQH